MQPTESYKTLARYNQWANAAIYDSCAGLTDIQRKKEMGVPLHSIHGTLNHLLLADRHWLNIFRGVPKPPASIYDIVTNDFTELRALRGDLDSAICAWAEALDEGALARSITWVSVTKKIECTRPLWFLASHFFNHQTFHRGQLTILLAQSGIDYGLIDLLLLPEAS